MGRDKTKGIWDYILNHKKVLSDEEAEAMEETIKKIRKEYGFRDKHRINLED